MKLSRNARSRIYDIVYQEDKVDPQRAFERLISRLEEYTVGPERRGVKVSFDPYLTLRAASVLQTSIEPVMYLPEHVVVTLVRGRNRLWEVESSR